MPKAIHKSAGIHLETIENQKELKQINKNCFLGVFNYVYVYRYTLCLVLLCVIFVSLVVVLLGSSIRLRFDTLFHPRARTGLDSVLFLYSSDGDGSGLVAIPI